MGPFSYFAKRRERESALPSTGAEAIAGKLETLKSHGIDVSAYEGSQSIPEGWTNPGGEGSR